MDITLTSRSPGRTGNFQAVSYQTYPIRQNYSFFSLIYPVYIGPELFVPVKQRRSYVANFSRHIFTSTLWQQ